MSQMWFVYEHKGREIAGIYADPRFRFKAKTSRYVRRKRASDAAKKRAERVGRQSVASPFFGRVA